MRAIKLVSLSALALVCGNISALPPLPSVNVANTVDAQVVNVIPVESLLSLGGSFGTGGPSPGPMGFAYANIPPGVLHSINASLVSPPDSTCQGFLTLKLQSGTEEKITDLGALVATNGNSNSLTFNLSTPIELDFDYPETSLFLGFIGGRSATPANTLCWITLGGVYEKFDLESSAKSVSSGVKVVKIGDVQ